MNAEMTRRDFLESGTCGVLGFSLLAMPALDQLAAGAEPKKVAEIPVLWLATGSCTGCSVALLNTASPTIQELLLGEVLPGKHVSLAFHTTIMAASGEPAMDAMHRIAREHKGGYVLVVDGATAGSEDGLYCFIGEREDGSVITGYEHLRDLGRNALAVLATGACASFGGIPSAGPNPTGAMSVQQLFEKEGIETPVVNIPGCPPHPDWIVGTIATVLLKGVGGLELDELHRPAPYFKPCIHDHCSLRGHFERGEFAEHYGEPGCLIKLGCKGPITYADCPIRKFNNGTSWCCEVGHPCIGCCHEDFPFEKSMFGTVTPAGLTFPATYTTATEDRTADRDTYTAVGLIGLGGFLAGLGVSAAVRKLSRQDDHEQQAKAGTPDGGGSA